MNNKKREFGEGPFFTILNYIYWFLLGNSYFLLLNIPLIFIMFIIYSNGTNPLAPGFNTIFFISCIPVGPAATALFSVMGKIIREHDVSITKDFFRSYKTNFLQATFLWTIEMLVILMLYLNSRIFIFKHYPYILTNFMYLLIIFVVITGFYAFPLVSRFYLKSKDIIRLSTYYTIKKFNYSVMNLIIITVLSFIVLRVSSFAIVFIISFMCFLIMYNERKVLIETEENFKANNEKQPSCLDINNKL